MTYFTTAHFSIDDEAIAITNASRPSVKLRFQDIDSVQIHKDSKYPFMKFSVCYWITWLALSLSVISYALGPSFILEALTSVNIMGVVAGLGSLAWRPVFAMVPKITLMTIQSKGQQFNVIVEDLVKEDKLNQLTDALKRNLVTTKFSIE